MNRSEQRRFGGIVKHTAAASEIRANPIQVTTATFFTADLADLVEALDLHDLTLCAELNALLIDFLRS